jgi:predicted dehydrogenase
LEHFAHVVRREEVPAVDLAHAMHVLSVGLAAHESAATGQRIPIKR